MDRYVKKKYKNKDRKDSHQFHNSGHLWRGREETRTDDRLQRLQRIFTVFLYTVKQKDIKKGRVPCGTAGKAVSLPWLGLDPCLAREILCAASSAKRFKKKEEEKEGVREEK